MQSSTVNSNCCNVNTIYGQDIWCIRAQPFGLQHQSHSEMRITWTKRNRKHSYQLLHDRLLSMIVIPRNTINCNKTDSRSAPTFSSFSPNSKTQYQCLSMIIPLRSFSGGSNLGNIVAECSSIGCNTIRAIVEP